MAPAPTSEPELFLISTGQSPDDHLTADWKGGPGHGDLGGRALARSEQITGRERDRIAALLRERYEQGAAIRDLAAQTGRSYGWVRTLLLETGVVLRTRGGDHSNRQG